MWVVNLSLILLNTSSGIYSVPKEKKQTAVFLSINNEAQCIPLLFLSSRFITYNACFVLGKLFLEKTTLNLAL